MSQSIDSVQGFRPKYYEDGRSADSRITPILVGNSQTLQIGSRAKMVAADGVHPANAVGDLTNFYIVGFAVQGIPVSLVANNSVLVDGTYTVRATGDTYAASADNLTDKKVVALCVPAEGLVCSGKLDADAGTTTGSDLPQYYIDIETTAGNFAAIIDESSAVSNATANFQTVAVRGNEASCIDPDDPATASRRILVKAAELGNVGGATRQAA
jgi:hypothetical protein